MKKKMMIAAPGAAHGRWSAAVVVALVALCTTTLAQQSASFTLEESVVNAGGRPAGGTVSASRGYRVSLDSIGEAVAHGELSGGGFRVDGAFVVAYVPPGEARNLRFTDTTTLVWDAEKSVGSYAVYRDLLTALPAGDYGVCYDSGLTEPTASDGQTPPPDTGRFYLVTARNRLGEEGTKGYDSSSGERANPAPCP